MKTADSQESKTAATFTAQEGEQRCEETAPQCPDDGPGTTVGAGDTSLSGDGRHSTDVGGGGLCRPTVDDDQEDQESLEDGEENGDESPSETTGVEAPEVPPDPVDRGSLLSGLGVESL